MVLICSEKRRKGKVDPKATSEIEEQDEAIDIAADSCLEDSHATAFGFEQTRPKELSCNTGKGFMLKYQS